MRKLRARLIDSTLDVLSRINAYAPIYSLLPNVLTVLNYHRIEDPNRAGFDTFKLNVSATPQDFARQMEYVKKNFNVITCEYLVACLHNDAHIPPNAAIITFDDGYYDNLEYAFPVLQKNNLPAVIFLTTDFIGSRAPFYWDFVAYCFYHTKMNRAFLPVVGERSWGDDYSRDMIMLEWIESLKKIPEVQKQDCVSQIGELLDVFVPDRAFEKLYLNWDQVRAMSGSGLVEFGSHTVSHPILTRIPVEQALREICDSRSKIEKEVGKSVNTLAYPNGGSLDFSAQITQAARDAGIEAAFSLLPGPTLYKTVRKDPFSIRRIYLAYHDSFPRFLAKVSGLSRLQK